MRTTGWGLGLAAAGMVFVASPAHGQVRAGASGSTGGSGATGGSASRSSSGSTSQTSTLTGSVQSFDRSSNTLVLSGSDRPLKVDSSTRVSKDGARASIDDIKEGDQVRASFSGAGDTASVQRLDILPKGSAAGSSSGTSSGSR